MIPLRKLNSTDLTVKFLRLCSTTTSIKKIGHMYYYPSDAIEQSSTTTTGVRRVVLICGWTNGTSEQIAKYASIYNRVGIDAIAVTTSSRDFLTSQYIKNDVIKYQKEVVDGFIKLNLLPNPNQQNIMQSELIVHSLSNGGLWNLSIFQENFPQFSQLKFSHMIMDSCPSGDKIRPSHYAQAAIASYKSPVMGYLSASIAYTHLVILKLVAKLSLGRIPTLFTKISETFFREPYVGLPTLYLYSDADDIITSDLVESQIAKHKDLVRQFSSSTSSGGASVDGSSSNDRIRSKNFVDSPHVLHFRKYPNEYQRLVLDFIGHN